MKEVKKATISQRKYDEANTTRVALKLNYKTDNDILQAINEVVEAEKTSKQGAIKILIRNGIKKD